MKQKLFRLFTILIFIPVLLLSACSNKNELDLSFYLSENATGAFYSASKNSRTIKSNVIYSQNLDKSFADEYYSITLKSYNSYMYKMYIEYIEFYIYTSEDYSSQMTVNISITNLADLSNLQDYSTFSNNVALYPASNKSYLFKVNVDKIVAVATTCSIKFDLTSSSDVILSKNGNENTFKWLVYGLKIVGENKITN